MASLTIVIDGAEQRFPLEAATVTLGRGLESDIRLKDIKASRRHCQIVKTPKGYQCVDLSSGNGTYVNGVQIKQQILGAGDKITIGSTTIAFEESAPPPKAAPPKAVSSKGPTAKLPLATAPAPAPAPASKTASVKVATAKVQVAPTRKVTARVDAVKPASQGALKPAAAKSGTRLRQATARTSGTRGPRPGPEAPRKKKSPLLLVGIAIAVLLLAGGGYFLFGGRDSADPARAQIEALMKKAEAADKAERYDEAIRDCEKALELCQGERYKMQASDIGKQIQLIKSHRSPPTPVRNDPKDGPEKGPDVAAKRAEIAAKFKLDGDPGAADWSGAVKEWSDVAKAKPGGELKTKAEAEIRAIHAKAKLDLDRLRKKAEALAQENKMAEALDLLRQQKPRFEHTELQADLEAAIRPYDK